MFGPGWQATPAASFYTDKLVQDFSFAGYHRGESPLPAQPPGATYNVVTGYGADPAGQVDSTLAIQNAIDAATAARGGVVWLPAGNYRLSPQGANDFALSISGSGVVLRGAGAGKSFLLNTSWMMQNKSIIRVLGPAEASWATVQNPSTVITMDLMGPTTRIPVQSVAGFQAGNYVIVRADPRDEWALEHGETNWVGAMKDVGPQMYLRQIVNLDVTNNIITLDIPTRYALKTRDNARVYKKTTLIAEVGLEDFSIGNVQHPSATGWGAIDYDVPGTGAYDVSRASAIRFSYVRDGWIRNVQSYRPQGNTTTCHNLSNGIRLWNCRGITITGCYFQRPQYGGGDSNGYLFSLSNSGDCLVQDSTAEFCRHGFIISQMASSGNVLYRCLDKTTGKQTGATGNEDTGGAGSEYHMHFSHSCLIDNCIGQDGWFEAAYREAGTEPMHRLTSAHSVFWNMEGRGNVSRKDWLVHSQQSRYGYVIGTRGSGENRVRVDGWPTYSIAITAPQDHVEGVGLGDTLTPGSLFEEQRRRRIATLQRTERTILDETWSDGERGTQNLPGSAAWYSSGASNTLTATAGSMTQLVGGTTAMDIAYLTGAYNSTIDLGIGESLRLSYDISFANRTGSGYFRVGLFNTVVDPRIAADEGGASSNPAYLGANGYMVNTGGLDTGNSVDFRRRTSATSQNLMSSTSAYFTLAGATTFASSVTNDGSYAGVLEITRTGDTDTTLFTSLTGPDNTVLYSHGSSDSASHYYRFNTFGIISSSVNADSFTLHSVKISVMSPPPPQITSFSFMSDGTFTLSGTGPVGQSYQILATTNLLLPLNGWELQATGYFDGGTFAFSDQPASNHARRFYRVATP